MLLVQALADEQSMNKDNGHNLTCTLSANTCTNWHPKSIAKFLAIIGIDRGGGGGGRNGGYIASNMTRGWTM